MHRLTFHGLWFVLSRGPIGEIEYKGSCNRDEQGCDKSDGKAQWSDVAVVQEGQQNGEDHGQGEAQHVTLEIDRFAWLTCRTLHEHPPILNSSSPLYFTRNGFEFSPEAVVTVRRTRPFFPPLGTVVVMLSLVC